MLSSSSKKCRFICNILSFIFYTIGANGIATVSNINVYLISYIHITQKDVDASAGNVLNLLFNISLATISPFSGLLATLLGSRLSMLVGSIILEIATVGLLYCKSIGFLYLLLAISGLGAGIGFLIPMKNCCSFYPKSKGVTSGSLLAVTFMLSFFCYFLAEYIIVNPKKVPPKDGLYPKEIAEKILNYFTIILILNPVSTLISLLLFHEYKKEDAEEENVEKDTENNINKMEPLVPVSTNENSQDGQKLNDNKTDDGLGTPENNNTNEYLLQNTEDNNNEIKKAKDKKEYSKCEIICYAAKILITGRFWRLVFFTCSACLLYMFVSSTFRTYIIKTHILEQDSIFFLILLSSILAATFTPIWGYISDKKGFRKTAFFFTSSIMVFAVLLFFFFEKSKGFLILTILCFSITYATGSVINPHLMFTYGIDSFVYIGGFILFMKIFAGLGFSFLTMYLMHTNNVEELNHNMRIAYIGTGIMGFFAMISAYFDKEEKYEKILDE